VIWWFVISWFLIWCRERGQPQTGRLRILLIWWAAHFCDLVVCYLVQGERAAADR
jgi:hypothetical protein